MVSLTYGIRYVIPQRSKPYPSDIDAMLNEAQGIITACAWFLHNGLFAHKSFPNGIWLKLHKY